MKNRFHDVFLKFRIRKAPAFGRTLPPARAQGWFVLAVFGLSIGSGDSFRAGEGPAEPKGDPAPIEITAENPAGLDVTFILPGWLMGLDGTVGVQGLETQVDAGVDELLKNLDMIAAGTLEVRQGKFGFILDGLYSKLSVGGTPPGPLLSGVSVEMEQVLAEGTLTYRFFESDRAWVELIAGARYLYLGSELSFEIEPDGARVLSEELSASIVDRTVTATREALSQQLSGLLGDIQQRVGAAVQQKVNRADKRVSRAVASASAVAEKNVAKAAEDARDRVESLVDVHARVDIRDRVLEGIGFSGPGIRPGRETGYRDSRTIVIGEAIANSGRVREAVRDLVEAQTEAAIAAVRADAAILRANTRDKVERKISAARAKIRSKAETHLAAAESRIRKEAEAKVAKAEARLAKTIESEIERKIPDSPVSASKGWVDPFIGLRGRCQLYEDWYLAARGDIGGFGVSSDLTWNLYGALGVELCENVALEMGYRYLSIDYQSGGFNYDMAQKGPFIGVLIEF